MRQRKRIRDGLDRRTIRLEPGCGMEIEASGEFRRLRFIRTLGLSHLVYPSANENRYSHCLGAANLAKMFCEELEIPESASQLLFAAMLLHDLGHGPYSHATEGLGKADHEERTIGLITGEIKMPRKRCGRISQIIKESGFDPAEIKALLMGKHPFMILNQLVSGYFDLDKADYLRRDSNLTAFIGAIDIERMCDVLAVEGGSLCLLEEGIDSFEHFVNARKNMYRNVYNHPKTSIYESMLAKAVKAAGINPDDMWWWTDSELESSLVSCGKFPREVVDLFIAGECYKPALSFSSNRQESLEAAKRLAAEEKLEERLARHAGLREEDIVVSYKLPKENEEAPYFPILAGGKVCNAFEYNESAASAEKKPATLFYAQVAVHPEAEMGKREKVRQMAESLSKAA